MIETGGKSTEERFVSVGDMLLNCGKFVCKRTAGFSVFEQARTVFTEEEVCNKTDVGVRQVK